MRNVSTNVKSTLLPSSSSRSSDPVPSDIHSADANHSVQDLLTASIGGRNLRAFRALVDRHQSRLEGLAAKYVDLETAEDVVQEVFQKVLEGRVKFDATRGREDRYLNAMAVNGALKRVDRSSRDVMARALRVDPGATIRTAIELTDSRAKAPLDALVQKESGRIIRERVAELTEKQIAVIDATYWDGKTLLEYARESGIVLRTAQEQRKSALVRLRGKLTATFGEYVRSSRSASSTQSIENDRARSSD